MIRLLICDDSAAARDALREVLARQPEIEIVGEAADGEEAISLAVALSPDVVLMDVAMPVLDGVTATRRIRQLLPTARIVAFAASDDAAVVTKMIEAGASAYCVKGAPLWELERAIAGASEPLVRLAHGLARLVNGGGTGELVARELADLTGAALAATYLSAPDVGLSLAGMAGPVPPRSLASAPGLVLRSFSQRALVRADAHELAELYRLGAPCAEALAAPLVADGDALGALLVAMPATVQLEADPELVSAVADLAAATVANERKLARTFAEARCDALTGLGNQRAFEELLDKAVSDAVELDRQAAVVLFDLDDFKQINDREGHPIGDRVLREVGRVVLRSLRAHEEVFRIGGEEFGIVIDGGSEAAARVAERVRTALLGQRRGHPLPTLSAGVASFPADAETKDELLRKADLALYAAKWAGKNRVVVYSEDLEAADRRSPRKLEKRIEDERRPRDRGRSPDGDAGAGTVPAPPREDRGLRMLLVDDDPGLRILLRTTFEVIDIEVEEAESAAEAAEKIALRPPDVVVLDVGMPGMDGLSFCRKLKADPGTCGIAVVLLTGADEGTEAAAQAAGADAFLRKPFSPLELLSVVERLAGGLYEGPFRATTQKPPEEQLLLYAQDLRRLLEVERGQRVLLQKAYRETVTALAAALESKDTGTGAHSQRVQRYATVLAWAIEPKLMSDPSVEYGFLLHDVGKIGIPDKILQKPARLTGRERRLMQTHTVLGEQMLGEVALLQGEGLKVVRSHHERWDGRGYPDGLAKAGIPLGARIFAVADALDAMTTDRLYRPAGSWDVAVEEIVKEAKRQFDPDVVDAFREREARLRRIHYELTAPGA